jgi:hypothetical protein
MRTAVVRPFVTSTSVSRSCAHKPPSNAARQRPSGMRKRPVNHAAKTRRFASGNIIASVNLDPLPLSADGLGKAAHFLSAMCQYTRAKQRNANGRREVLPTLFEVGFERSSHKLATMALMVDYVR